MRFVYGGSIFALCVALLLIPGSVLARTQENTGGEVLTISDEPLRGVTFVGQVVSVDDGRTLNVLTPEKTTRKLRLAQVEVPESDEPYGHESKKLLSDLVLGKQIRARMAGTADSGITLATVYIKVAEVIGPSPHGKLLIDPAGDHLQEINAEMLVQGAAWAPKQHSDGIDLTPKRLEEVAKDKNRGIWALDAEQQAQIAEIREHR